MANKKTANEERRQSAEALLYQYQMLSAQMEALQKQASLIAEGMEEVSETIRTLEGMKSLKKGDEILVPLGSGTFTHGALTDVSGILVNIGADVVRKKSVDDARGTLEKRKTEMESLSKRLAQDLTRVQTTMAALEPEIQAALGQKKD
ncbi:MAG: prefoldin subunit alpha [Candidatus Aenigmatarchaeota archaeon]|nr:MAG: prefoldin subunit alpha [Candidatus Aenigmarchaeota archaeon]